jgi:3-carboxy-cis,cis-muconate cycloisomerase
MSVNPADSAITRDLFGTEEMRRLFGDAERLAALLQVEAALARTQARLGLIPAAAADSITAAAKVDNLDVAAIAASTQVVGYPVVALTKQLAKAAGGEAARWVHWGATTQDILDTGLVLQMREGLALVERDVKRILRALSTQAKRHRETVMAGRTHLQHALPVTFGYKCAIWASPLLDHLDRLRELKPRLLRVEFGGAVGTLASLGDKGRAVVEGLAQELGLAAPDAPWHATRESIAETGAVLALVCGSLAKLATDFILLMQTEIGELNEPYLPGRGGSSTMPQKRNPIASEYVLACARGVQALQPLLTSAMAGDHERSTGPWQSEQLALPQIFLLTSGCLAHAALLAEGMRVDADAMRKNLDSTGGLIMAEAVMMALAGELGRGAAHELVEHACGTAIAEHKPLIDVLAADGKLTGKFSRADLERILDPKSYLGEARAVVDRLVKRAEKAL